MDDPATPAIACIVEGEGEEEALPILIRRVAAAKSPPAYLDVSVPKRMSRDALVKPGGIEGALAEVVRKIGPRDAILVLLDADDDCPADLGSALLHRAQVARPDRLISVVLAKREFEAWFLAAAISLRSKRDLPADLQPPPQPDDVRGAKEWLRARMPRGRTYRERLDQPALTAVFDLDAARLGADSFDKCYREIARLIAVLNVPAPP